MSPVPIVKLNNGVSIPAVGKHNIAPVKHGASHIYRSWCMGWFQAGGHIASQILGFKRLEGKNPEPINLSLIQT